MALSDADEADNGYSPPTPTPNTNSDKDMAGNSTDGSDDSIMLAMVKHVAPNAMSDAVIMLPFLLPIVFANIPKVTIPTITPRTTEYDID